MKFSGSLQCPATWISALPCLSFLSSDSPFSTHGSLPTEDAWISSPTVPICGNCRLSSELISWTLWSGFCCHSRSEHLEAESTSNRCWGKSQLSAGRVEETSISKLFQCTQLLLFHSCTISLSMLSHKYLLFRTTILSLQRNFFWFLC